MRPLSTLFVSICGFSAALIATAASANLQISFIEGAPKDRFQIENMGTCNVSASTLRLDLSTSKGALIFDVTRDGAGVEVFQPFEMLQGGAALSEIPNVVDGQSSVDLEISELTPGAVIAFSIDVDDTVGQREITVAGSEIDGATASLIKGQETTISTFTSQAYTALSLSSC
ncbi:MAG: aggregation factor core [Pseudoruegeria sp.]